MLATYQITKLFTGGLLKGLTHTSEMTVDLNAEYPALRVGWECKKPIGGSPYRIVAIARIR